MTDESAVREWLAAAGYQRADGTWIYPPGEPAAAVAMLFAEYARRTGYPLSVARGQTGSAGPLYAPRALDLLGRGMDIEVQRLMVITLLHEAEQTHNWHDAIAVTRSRFERTRDDG